MVYQLASSPGRGRWSDRSGGFGVRQQYSSHSAEPTSDREATTPRTPVRVSSPAAARKLSRGTVYTSRPVHTPTIAAPTSALALASASDRAATSGGTGRVP